MKYTDYCPNCSQKLEIEEFTNNYVFVYNGRAVRRCPGCSAKLEIVDGVIIVVDLDQSED